MVDRVEVFVDTSYLLASFYNSWTTGARAQLEIDLPSVTEHLNDIVSKKLDLPVFRQFWYDGIPDSGPHRYQRTLRHIDGVQLRAGQLIEWGDRRTQKGVDTRLVADMVLHAVRGHVQEIVLVSGDADMIPGVQVAIEHGVRVHLIGFGWDSMSNSLRSACDTVTVLDPRDDFEESMHIDVLDSFTPMDTREKSNSEESSDDSQDDGSQDSTEVDSIQQTPGTADSDTTTSDTDADAEDPVVNHSVPLIPPVLSPGKTGRRGAPNRIRTRHAALNNDEVETDSSSDPTASRFATTDDKNGTTSAPTEMSSGVTSGMSDAKTDTITSEKISAKDEGITTSAEEAHAAAQVAAHSDTVSVPDAELHRPDMCHHEAERKPSRRPLPSMMAQKRHPVQRSRYVPLPYDEVWESAGDQTPFDIGQQYAIWWYNNVASPDQRTNAHTLTGGGLPTEVDRPLLQFACQTLDAYTLSDSQRVNLRDGFHMGIRSILMKY